METVAVVLLIVLQIVVHYVSWILYRPTLIDSAKYAVMERSEVVPAPEVKPEGDAARPGSDAADETKLDDDLNASGNWGQKTMMKWGSEESMEKKRGMIINEMIQTEESYLRSLHQLQSVWIRPMTKAAGERSLGLTAKDLQMLSFTSLEMIIALHDALLPQLKSAADVGAAFVKFGDFLKMYTTFVNSYDNVLSVLSSLKKNRKFSAFTEKVRAGDPGASLDSLMIMPIQRVPRYLLLLTELKKNTPEFHRDYPALATACDRLRLIASHINSAKANFENVNKILQIQNRITNYDGSLVEPGRILLYSGQVETRKPTSGFSAISRHMTSTSLFYVFSDVCLWTSTSHKFKVCGGAIVGWQFSEAVDRSGDMEIRTMEVGVVPDAIELKLASAGQELLLVFENPHDVDLWRSQLDKAIAASKEST